MSNQKLENSLKNLEAAYSKLEEYLALPIQNARDRSGIIKGFEFTFELAWKTFQKIAIDEGLEAGGPRSSLKQAFKLGWVDNEDEKSWLKMLDDRNLMSHTYRDLLSKEIVKRIQDNYQSILSKTLLKLKTR